MKKVLIYIDFCVCYGLNPGLVHARQLKNFGSIYYRDFCFFKMKQKEPQDTKITL